MTTPERTQFSHDDPVAGRLTFDVTVAGPPDGDVAILLHGFPQTAGAYRHVIGPLAEAGYRVLAPDQRGYSPGARPEGVADYRIDRLVGDVVALADWAGADRVHLVGHDWGAMVAWHTAQTVPQRLRTVAPLSVPHPRAFAEALAGEDQQQRSGYVALFRAEGSEDAMLADDAAGLRFVYEASGMTAEEAAPYLATLAGHDALRAALSWYRATDLADASSADVTTPTLFVWSDADVALGPDGAHATQGCVSGPYRFVVLEGIDHWIPEHAPDRLVDELLAWWTTHP